MGTHKKRSGASYEHPQRMFSQNCINDLMSTNNIFFAEVLIMGTHKVYFRGEITKNIYPGIPLIKSYVNHDSFIISRKWGNFDY